MVYCNLLTWFVISDINALQDESYKIELQYFELSIFYVISSTFPISLI